MTYFSRGFIFGTQCPGISFDIVAAVCMEYWYEK